MKASVYKNMKQEELVNELAKLKKQLFNLRFQLAAGQQTNNQALVVCKRNIARVKTVLREYELSKKPEAKN